MNYPVSSDHLWLMIQRGFYNITTKWDLVFPNIEHITRQLEQNIKKVD